MKRLEQAITTAALLAYNGLLLVILLAESVGFDPLSPIR